MRSAIAWLTLAMLLPAAAATLWAYFRLAPKHVAPRVLRTYNRAVLAVGAAVALWSLDHVLGTLADARDYAFGALVAGYYLVFVVVVCTAVAAALRRMLYGPPPADSQPPAE